MRRRRLLLASLSALSGCTATGYRTTGPRTPPPAPETDTAPSAPVDSVEERAQAVLRPLNDLYRLVRGPLGSFELADVTAETLDAAESSVTRAREALTAFSREVTDPPARYRSLPTLVTAHESLFDGLRGAVTYWSTLSRLGNDGASGGSIASARSARETLTAAATSLREVADRNPTVPAALFLTAERTREFATTLETQSAVAGRLVDASDAVLAGRENWHTAVDAFERDALSEARAAFDDARVGYRAAVDALERATDAEGSFAALTESRSCVAQAGVDATAIGFDAVDAAAAGDSARAARLLDRAETTRTRCTD